MTQPMVERESSPSAREIPPRPARRRFRSAVPPVGKRDVVKFGIVMLVGGGLLALLLFLRHHPLGAEVVGAICGVLGLLALLAPGPLRPVYAGWMKGAHVLGWINTRILLAAIYWAIFTSIALVFRLIGRDALKRRIDREAETYWEPKSLPEDPKRYFDLY